MSVTVLCSGRRTHRDVITKHLLVDILFDLQESFHLLQVTTRRGSDECATRPATKTSNKEISGMRVWSVDKVVASGSTERRFPYYHSHLSTVGNVASQSEMAGHKLHRFGASKFCSVHVPKHPRRQSAKTPGDLATVIAVLVQQSVDDLLGSVESLLAEHIQLRFDVIKFGEVKCSKLVGNPPLRTPRPTRSSSLFVLAAI